jgi:glycosyltransferase involved in cell wall biosynthesis
LAQTQESLIRVTREKLLLLLPQIPHDPASGAARTMALTATVLGEAGFDVRALGTTASEGGDKYDPVELLKAHGAEPRRNRADAGAPNEIHYTLGALSCVLLDVGATGPVSWRQFHVPAFNQLLQRELAAFKPDIVLTYGGYPDDVARVENLRAGGTAVVLGLWNLGYLRADRKFFARYDAIIGPSQYLADVYRAVVGIRLTPLTTPVYPEDVRPDKHDAVFFTMVNPSWEKGLGLLIRLAEMLGSRRPDIPLLIVESRGTTGQMVAVAAAAGIDLTRHKNLMFSPTVSRPSEFFAVTRATVVPSLVSEGSGRIASESMVAGIPALVSDRGGLPAEVGQGGFVIPVPDSVLPESKAIVTEAVAELWLRLMERLADDEPFYREACARAKLEGARVLPETLRPIYAELFRRIAKRDPSLSPFS